MGLLTRGNEARLGEGTATPREALFVPTREGRERHSVCRRVDEPAVAEIDAHVVDLRGLRFRALRPEEEDVGGLEYRDGNAFCDWNLAAHRVGSPTLEHVRERAPVRVLLDLVDAPDESRAVETAVDLPAERRLGRFGG